MIINEIFNKIFVKGMAKFEKYKNVGLGVFLIVVSIIMYIQTYEFVSEDSINNVDSAAFAPRLVYGGLLIFGIMFLIKGFFETKKVSIEDILNKISPKKVSGNQRAVIMLGVIALYIILISLIGFIPAAIIYMIISFNLLMTKESRNMKVFAIVSVIVSIVVYYSFKNFIYVRLPIGEIFNGLLGG